MRYTALIQRRFTVRHTAGNEIQCMCRWHNDTGAGNLYVNAESGLYVCFSCGKKGKLDSEELPALETENVRERLRKMTTVKVEQHYYPEGWLKKFDMPTDYWTDVRGMSPETVKQFGLGFDPFSNRATLPLRDVFGRVLGVTYRRLDDGKPKYLHPKGFPVGRHLYASWLLQEERTVGLVEGQVDAIAGWGARIPTLGLMGSRLTADQIKVLQRLGIRKVVLMLDNDYAGQKGTVNVYGALQGSGIQVVAGWYRPYWVERVEGRLRPIKDPDGLTGERLRKMYHSAVPILDWIERSGFVAN